MGSDDDRPAEEARARGYRAAGYWTDRLLSDFFDDAVAAFPDKVAVGDDRFGALTYAEMDEQVGRLAAALAGRGLGRGDRFVIALPNWQQVPVFVLALNRLGAVGVHLPITGGAHEFGGVLGITAARGIVVPGAFRGVDYPPMIDAVAGDELAIRVVVEAPRAPPGWTGWERLIAEARSAAGPPGPPAGADEPTAVLFTSGSSGTPKGVVHSANSLGALNTTVAPIYGLGPDDVIFMGAPLGFSAGLVHGPRLAIYLGARLVLQESWNAERALAAMAREQATFTLTTPTLLRDLLASERFDEHALHLALRLVFCGGSYVSADLLAEAHARLPQTLTTVIWGMTEGIGTACRPGTPLERLLASDGQPFLGTELRVLGEHGEELGPGQEGDLVMRGPQRFLGYYAAPHLDAETLLPGGWVRTGDVARIEADGHVKITGRRKELIIRGGANIAPTEIEELLRDDPAIADIVVVGVPDERLGERVCACVVPRAGQRPPSLEDLVERARGKGLAREKWPERLEIIDSVPLTSAGKVRRPLLREAVCRRIATGATGGSAG